MVNAEGQNAVRADEDTFENVPLPQQYPLRYDEHSEWIPQQCPIAEEENRAHMSAFTILTRTQWILD
eukprot:4824938-Pyramimonas_sp.AAC.1